MKKIQNNEKENMEEKVLSVGLNLSLLSSLVNFLEYGITDSYNFSKTDIANLVVVMRKMIGITRDEYEEIEGMIDL